MNAVNALPAGTRVRSVTLTVRDLGRLTEFYRTVLGLELLESAGGQTVLGAGGSEIVRLIGDETAERSRLRAGLFHLAILLPTRRDLATSLVRLLDSGHALGGASDHGVSEALYLSDPEGNGIELYRDRAREEWPMRGSQLAMVTEPLDLSDLIALAADPVPERVPEETRLGHVHLHVTDIPAANDHYVELVGFALMQRYGRDASFFGAGGYHHHVGVNVWGPRRTPAEPGALGLRWFDLEVPDEAHRVRLAASDVGNPETEDGHPLIRDPAGNLMRVVAPASA